MDSPPVLDAEEHLVGLLAGGTPEAIEMLYDRFGGLAYALAFRVLGDAGAAEDVVQDAFISVWRRGESYRPERGSLRSWLCAIVHHRAVDRVRASARRGHEMVLHPEQGEAVAAAAPGSVVDVWETVSHDIERDRVRGALSALSSDQRRTLELAYYGGYSQSEIGAVLGVPLGTVKSRTRGALRRLRELLEEANVTETIRDV